MGIMIAVALCQIRPCRNGQRRARRVLSPWLWLWVLFVLQACSADHAQRPGAASLQVSGDAYYRLPVAGRSVSTAYLTLHNRSERPQVLTGFSSPQVRAIEMHQTVDVEGIMRMRRVPSYELLPGQVLQMQPGGYHLMLFGLPEHLAPSDKITVELVLDSGDNVSATLEPRRVR